MSKLIALAKSYNPINLLLLGTLISLTAFYLQYNLGFSVSILSFIIIVLTTLFSKKKGFLFFVFVVFIFDDIPYNIDVTINNVHNDLIFGQSLMKILTLFFSVVIGIDILKIKNRRLSDFTKCMIVLMTSSIIIGLLNGNLVYLNPFINDLRFFINYLISFFGILIYFKADEILQYLEYFVYFFVGKQLIFIIFLADLSSNQIVSSIGVDTGLYLSSFVICYFLYYSKHINFHSRFLLVGVVILSLFLAASRARMIISILHIIFLIFVSRKLQYLPLILFMSYVIFLTLPLYSYDIYEFFLFKFSSFNPEFYSGESSLVRLIEFKNIIGMNIDSFFKSIFGSGFGGYWDSKRFSYGFNLHGTTSYPTEWIINDRYFKPHGIPQFAILKFGFVGAAVFYFYILKNFLLFRKIYDYQNRILFGVFSSGLIVLYLVAYSSKLQFFAGIFSAVSYSIYLKNLNENN